jgi:hypothetical protein
VVGAGPRAASLTAALRRAGVECGDEADASEDVVFRVTPTTYAVTRRAQPAEAAIDAPVGLEPSAPVAVASSDRGLLRQLDDVLRAAGLTPELGAELAGLDLTGLAAEHPKSTRVA